ncbi:MAG: molybdopterin molybdotransferase MoeA [Thermaerobacter sp.]|nr:molybdopterin molybdotransferase MoeA [Thermaerobacter sp.]
MGRSTVEELQQLVLAEVAVLPAPERVPLPRALGRCLTEDLTAPINVPLFTRSAVDGYALRSADTRGASAASPVTLTLIEKVTTGHVPQRPLHAGQTALTTTGAMLPAGADAVVLVEKATQRDQTVTIDREIAPGEHMSVTGEDFAVGETILRQGHVLRLVDVAALAALGVTTVPVARRPQVAIFSTGDELVAPGDSLGPAQVYDANASLLEAAVLEAGGEPHRLGTIPDQADLVEHRIYQACANDAFDLVVTTGGTGASLLVLEGQDVENIHDLIPGALAKRGRLKSHGLLMVPGKPTAFGEVAGTPVFALAGWPYSVIMTFHLFVRPAIRKMAGLPPRPPSREVSARLSQEVATEPGVRKYFQVRLGRREGEVWADPLLPPRPPSAARTMHQMLQGTGYFHLDGVHQLRAGPGDAVRVVVDDPLWQ